MVSVADVFVQEVACRLLSYTGLKSNKYYLVCVLSVQVKAVHRGYVTFALFNGMGRAAKTHIKYWSCSHSACEFNMDSWVNSKLNKGYQFAHFRDNTTFVKERLAEKNLEICTKLVPFFRDKKPVVPIDNPLTMLQEIVKL